MTLSSMTGFARTHGSIELGSGSASYEWELKSVNAKGFDLRFRLPSGMDDVETAARKQTSELISRGTVYANLTLKRATAKSEIRINEETLASLMRISGDMTARFGVAPPSVDGLMGIKGVLEIVEPQSSEEDEQTIRAAISASFTEALNGLVAMRKREGDTLGKILLQRMDDIEKLAQRAEAAPGRRPEAIKQRLAEQIASILETSERFDADRLNQEAVLIAAKADIREELDRIASHVSQVRELVAGGGAIGRRLDFLAQEFNREVNTCCSKSNDLELTNIGLEMKNIVEQFREQVQNLE